MVKETLRLRPVVPAVVRRLRAPMTFGGWDLPAGVHIFRRSTCCTAGRPLPRPARFRPERFLGDDTPGTYAWIPFGGGIRRCVGASFAQFEMKVVLRALLARIAVEPARTAPEKAKFRNVTLVPARGAELVLRDRPAPAARGGHDHESREQVAGAR